MNTRRDSDARARRLRRATLSMLGGALALVGACAGVADPHEAAPDVLRQESDEPPLKAEATDITATTTLFAAGECDAVYEFRAQGPGGPGTPQVVPVGGEYHPQIIFDPPWGEEKVQVISWRPLTDNAKVVHHWIVWEGQANMFGWAPGSDGRPYPADVGVDMTNQPGGLRLDMHYFNLNGTKEEYDRSGVALCVVKGANRRPKSAAIHGGFATFAPVMAPANTRGHVLGGSCKVAAKEPITVMSVSPHAHTRATHMTFSVVKPDGTEKVWHDQSFSFWEQVTWPFETPLILEDGDTVKWKCVYDNDSNKNIGFGESTQDEMCFHWAAYYPKGQFACGPTISGFPVAAPAAP
jgi:hypothetical protein